MSKIYVASSWRNLSQQHVVGVLRSDGHEVYDFRNPRFDNQGFKWSDIDPKWQKWTPKDYLFALNHPTVNAGFKLDFEAMKWADACVLLTPCGRSSHTEAGWMSGKGKRVIVYMPVSQEPELMYKIFDEIVLTSEELLLSLK